MYRTETSGIEVAVEPFYLEDRSEPDEDHYVWAYRVTIVNRSKQPVQLLRRYWNITDANGIVEEVRGDGVIGEQPELSPGDSYQYTSGCPLGTPSGIMFGSYTMTDMEGAEFDVAIPPFSLDMPEESRTLN